MAMSMVMTYILTDLMTVGMIITRTLDQDGVGRL